MGKLIDLLKADRDRAMAEGVEAVRGMLSQLREAVRAWDEGWSKGKAAAEGTPYWTSINVLENWLAGYGVERRASKRDARRLQRENQGLVYIAGAGPDTVKIGFTTNVRSRLKGLATSSRQRSRHSSKARKSRRLGQNPVDGSVRNRGTSC